MKKTVTYSKRHQTVLQLTDNFDDKVRTEQLGSISSENLSESSSSSSSPSLSHVNIASQGETSSSEETFITLGSQKRVSTRGSNQSRQKEQEKPLGSHHKVSVSDLSSSSSSSSHSLECGRKSSMEVISFEDDTESADRESQYTFVEVTATDTDSLSPPEQFRQEEKPQRCVSYDFYPHVQSLMLDDEKSNHEYIDAASLLSDKDTYADQQLTKCLEPPKVVCEQRPKFTSTLLDPVFGKDGQELALSKIVSPICSDDYQMKFEQVPRVACEQRPKFTSTLVDPVFGEDGQEIAFSQNLSTIHGPDSVWDENTCVKRAPEKGGRLQDIAQNRKAFTIKTKACVEIKASAASDENVSTAKSKDGLFAAVADSMKNIYQPSEPSMAFTDKKEKQPSFKTETSPHLANYMDIGTKMTSTPDPAEKCLPFILNLSPINTTCSSGEFPSRQSLVVNSEEIVAMETDEEQEMMLARAEIKEGSRRRRSDDDALFKVPKPVNSPYSCYKKNKCNQESVQTKDGDKNQVPLCSVIRLSEKYSNYPGTRLVKVANRDTDLGSVPDDFLELFGEKLPSK